MTQQVINIGNAPDDGTGDPLRTSFNKTNQNFTELYARTSGAPVGAEYITSTADATLTAERVLTDTATVTWDRTTAGQIKATAVGGGNVSNSGTPTAGQIAVWTDATHIQGIAAPFGPPQGRLTLQTATPVMITTQSAKTTIYYSPYCGNLLPIYDGASMLMTTFSELSVATTDTTKSPAAIGASKVNDWFVWNDAGTLRLGHGPDWTSDTVRSAGTALVMINGILLNAVALTNGPAIQRGTYVGTTRSNASSQLDWIYGTSAMGGGAAFFGVWNVYNRVNVATIVIEAAANWNATSLIRPFNNSINNRVSAVFGLAEDEATAFAFANVSGAATGFAAIGVGYNAITGFSGSWTSSYNANGVWSPAFGQYSTIPFGFNFWQWMEFSGTGSNSFGGSFPTVGAESSLQFRARM